MTALSNLSISPWHAWVKVCVRKVSEYNRPRFIKNFTPTVCVSTV